MEMSNLTFVLRLSPVFIFFVGLAGFAWSCVILSEVVVASGGYTVSYGTAPSRSAWMTCFFFGSIAIAARRRRLGGVRGVSAVAVRASAAGEFGRARGAARAAPVARAR
jgi:hypothetical protein